MNFEDAYVLFVRMEELYKSSTRARLRPFIDTKLPAKDILWPETDLPVPESWCSCGDKNLEDNPVEERHPRLPFEMHPWEVERKEHIEAQKEGKDEEDGAKSKEEDGEDDEIDWECPVHGTCDECEKENPQCDCQFFYEEHFCVTCGCELWLCECCHITEIRDRLYEF